MKKEEDRECMKPEQIDLWENSDNGTQLYRYYLAGHWCKGKEVLDAACGYGIGTNYLRMLAKNVTGVDIDKNAIKWAAETLKGNRINFQERDLTEVLKKDPFENKFDTIISIETFEHVPRHKVYTMLDNFVKWIKPGGTIFITTPQRGSTYWHYDEGGSHKYEYSWEEFMNIANMKIHGNGLAFGIKELKFDMGKKEMVCCVDGGRLNECHVMVIVGEDIKK